MHDLLYHTIAQTSMFEFLHVDIGFIRSSAIPEANEFARNISHTLCIPFFCYCMSQFLLKKMRDGAMDHKIDR